ncbi:RNA-dependent RNA polymerase 1 [Nephila pilipes]|uniref:RNA-directed RNA polymerase n=1 Tax=Nephila pilipes TaxID=299642 RepID=A0A8X6MWP8_NEPPI|nr:RNA-dependent RNA polymerase 1 [Nephila pilipes]
MGLKRTNMEELNFRIVYVPTEKYLSDDEAKKKIESCRNFLKECVESCELKNVVINLLKVKKSEEENYPEIEELVFQVQAKFGFSSQGRGRAYCYRVFCKNWKTWFLSSSPPILVFYENNSFINTRRTCDLSITYLQIGFGVLPFNGEFHEYASLSSLGYIDFFHDIRSVVIKYLNKELKFSYNNIRNIFINIDSCEVFFDLCNPPLIFRPQTKRNRYNSYVLNYRTADIDDVDVFGRSNVLRILFLSPSDIEEVIGRIHFRCSEKPIHYVNFKSITKPKPVDRGVNFSHFGCTYLMTAMFKRNFTLLAQASNIDMWLSEVQKLCQKNGDCLEKALVLVLAAIDSGKIVNYWHAIERQFHYYISNKDEINYAHYVVPEKCRLIRRVTLTPTRQLLWAPEIMFGNRVLRNFDSEYALRVSFRDDNNSRLSFVAAYADENVFDYSIRNPMLKGIQIGDRCYEFLAWSNSQIRDHGIWMYAKDQKGNTVLDIRKWMGDFSHIHSVPKYMARMGQCFSQTEDAVSVPLDSNYVRTEDDIKGGIDWTNGKSYCFSDGVGKISSNLAKKVRDALGHDKLCSAFQIRYGGYKGMLVVDPTLKGTDIIFRNSMKKFDSPQNIRLEIARTSAPISLQLNRPFITILNDMGVRHRTFLKLQENMLRTLTDILFDENKAAEFLESKTPNQIFSYKDLSESGIFLTTEPFFRSLLLALHRHHVEKIKSKANIAIDPNEGRNMLGVMDETGLLQYNEVFVQYTKNISYGETTKETVVLQREVLVTKNPCLLPGDVRKFQAVDIPQLHHIVDCIVFPQKGHRPHPNEMAGSDLDGDEYAVLWNDDLIFYRSNESPGHFPSAPEEINYNIKDSDMVDFLVKYIKNDQVGAIANAHLAHADSKGIFSAKCIAIAKKFSVAVDYAKTGVSRHLEPSERPEEFPDFMEKNYKETYNSKKALGKMFRVAHDYESENEDASIVYQDIKVDSDLEYPGWEQYKEDAIKSRNKFNALLKTILRNYGIQHEAEVFSGAFTNLHCRFHERKDRDEIEKVVVRCIKRLSKSMNEEFLEEFKNSFDAKKFDDRILKKASAWYIVTYRDSNAKFLSFPWTVSKFLANIKLRKNGNRPLLFSPIVEKLNEQIKLCESKDLLPYLKESNLWLEYDFTLDPALVQLAFRVLLFWAQDERVIGKDGQQGLMSFNTFLRLFLHVAEITNCVVRKDRSPQIIPQNKPSFSAASLCVEFFRFCLTLRFYNLNDIAEIIPFHVNKYSALSKRAVVAFHQFALLGKFQTLEFDERVEERGIQMKPFRIDSKIFPRIPVEKSVLQKATEALRKYSGVEEVNLREILQIKKIVVSATGTEQSLKALKAILNKKHEYLRKLFTTAALNEGLDQLATVADKINDLAFPQGINSVPATSDQKTAQLEQQIAQLAQIIDSNTKLSSNGQLPKIKSVASNLAILVGNTKFDKILKQYPELINPSQPINVDTSNQVYHHIETKGPPVFLKSCHLAATILKAVKKEFEYLMARGIIRPSKSPWASPLHVVKKSNGEYLPCDDYRRLNSVTLPDRYLVPHIQDCTQNLYG